MNIIRYDQVGTVKLRLLSRPTNTTIGVSNFHIYIRGIPGHPASPVVRFLGTDEEKAMWQYNLVVEDTQALGRAIQ